MEKLINISQICTLIKLINKKTQKPSTHVLRYWEKQFKEIKPLKINNRRYYSEKQISIIKLIKHLLKTKGMTINGAKKVLEKNINSLDDYNSFSLKADYHKISIKSKSKLILEKINKIRIYGKKNTY